VGYAIKPSCFPGGKICYGGMDFGLFYHSGKVGMVRRGYLRVEMVKYILWWVWW